MRRALLHFLAFFFLLHVVLCGVLWIRSRKQQVIFQFTQDLYTVGFNAHHGIITFVATKQRIDLPTTSPLDFPLTPDQNETEWEVHHIMAYEMVRSALPMSRLGFNIMRSTDAPVLTKDYFSRLSYFALFSMPLWFLVGLLAVLPGAMLRQYLRRRQVQRKD